MRFSLPLKTALSAAASLVAIASQAQPPGTPESGRLEENIAYREGEDVPQQAREACRLDVLVPSSSPGFATIVWLHAGGLTQGKRHIPEGLRNKGLAVVAVDYRLSPTVKAPAYIEDAAAAVAWTFRNIKRFGGSDERIIVAGASAGGYLACMVGLDKKWLAPYGISPDRIAGVASLTGQAITHFTVRQERGIPGTQPVIDELAPLFHVRADAPPLLLTTGDRDLELLGRYEENAYFQRMLRIAGHQKNSLTELKGRDHAGVEAGSMDLLVEFAKSLSLPPDGPVQPAR